MLGYRKRSFARAHDYLTCLRQDQSDLTALRELQKLLLTEIIMTEKRVRVLKTEVKRIDPDEPGANLKRFVFLTNRIEGLRRCAFIWRCFGDAIAFLYMDKYALKQTVYNTDNYNPKQSAGFLSGKEGLANELVALDAYLEGGIPALLVDITNTIRHGDVCLMVGSDPILVEVKKSKKLNPRGRKQSRSLEMLNALFETDKAIGLRGAREVQRRSLKVVERDFTALMNECISNARTAGHWLEQPEKGLFYVAMGPKSPNITEILRDKGLRRPLIYAWNMLKSQQTWIPFVPFTLTIQDKDALWDFIEGRLYIMVILEIDRLVEIAADMGVTAAYDEEKEATFPLGFELIEGTGLSGISSQMIARVGMECVSPETLIYNAVEMYRSFSEEPPTQQVDLIEPVSPQGLQTELN